MRLAQDTAFQQAVQSSHLQAAAKAAVSLLGVRADVAELLLLKQQACSHMRLLNCCDSSRHFRAKHQALHPTTVTLVGVNSRKVTGQLNIMTKFETWPSNFRQHPCRQQSSCIQQGLLCRVVIISSSRKMNQSIVGKEGQITQVLTNGWVNIFISSLKLNEQVQQRYLAHLEPGRVPRGTPAHPSVQETVQQQQTAGNEASLIDSFPELPHDLDGFVGGLDGDLFLDSSHPMSLGKRACSMHSQWHEAHTLSAVLVMLHMLPKVLCTLHTVMPASHPSHSPHAMLSHAAIARLCTLSCVVAKSTHMLLR